MNKKVIIPGVGFEKIKFGMTEEEVIALLGEPDEIEEQSYGEEEEANVYFYDELGLSMSFDSEEDFKLVEISFEDEVFILNDTITVGMTKERLMEEANSLGDFDVDDLSDEGFTGKELYVFEDKNINIWIDKNKVESIQIGPFWKDDENIDWPKK